MKENQPEGRAETRPQRKPHSVIFRYYTPVEGNLRIDAVDEEHARKIVLDLLSQRYHSPEVIDAYPLDPKQLDPVVQEMVDAVDTELELQTKKRMN